MLIAHRSNQYRDNDMGTKCGTHIQTYIEKKQYLSPSVKAGIKLLAI